MDSNSILLIIVLIAVILALVVSVIALLNSLKALEKSRSERIEGITKRTVENYMALNYNHKIRDIVHDEFVREQQKKEHPNSAVIKPVEPVVSSPKGEEKLVESAPIQELEPEKTPVEISLPEPVIYYTGICKDGAFKHVTTVPDNKTVYTIYADSKDAVQGVLNVDPNAYDKIAQTPDYLQNACVYSGNGTLLKVTKIGTVQKENGTWVVKEPIVAEFN